MSLLFPDLGDVCTAPMCGKYDLLPFTCKFCKGATCSAHQQCEDHACPDATRGDDFPPETRGTRPAAARASCDARGCHLGLPAYLHAKCEACARTFCVKHRFPEDHGCPSIAGRPASTAQLPPSLTAAEAALPYYLWKPANAPDKIDVSKVADPEKRVGLRVYFSQCYRARPLYLCVSRDWPVGKVLDLACAAGSVPNKNNLAVDEPRLSLFLLWGSCPPMPPSARVGDLLARMKAFRPGVGVMVHRGSELPHDVILAVPKWIISLRYGFGGHDLQATVQAKSWLEKLDEGPTLVDKARFVLRSTPAGQIALAAYVVFLLILGWVNPS